MEQTSLVTETLIEELQVASIEYPNPHDVRVVISVELRNRLVTALSAGHAQCSREAVIEECATLCDGLRRRDYSGENEDWIAGTSDCATAIRALLDTSTDWSSK